MTRPQIATAATVVLAVVVCWRAPLLPGAPEKRVTFSILEDWDKNDDLADVAKDFTLFRELGITTWRGSIGWDDYEPQRGHYDFEWLHRFADLAAQYGITLRPYLGYTPAWAAAGGRDTDAWNDPPRNIDDWTAFVRELASAMRRHTNVASYEIYNEENVPQWWDGSPEAYASVLDAAARAIADVSPGTQVLLGGMVYPDTGWVQHVCGKAREGDRFAILPFHAYPETWTPPDVDLEGYLGQHFEDGFVSTVDRACGHKPIWINETGFATTEGRTEREQADWWTRAIATFAAEPRVEHIGVYEIKDLRSDSPAIGGVANYHLGITNVDRTKKLAFHTVKNLAALFGDRFAIDDAVQVIGASTAPVYEHAFTRDDGREIVIVWSKGEPQTVDVHLAGHRRAAIEHHFDGSTDRYPHFNGRTLARVRLDPGQARTFEFTP